MAIIKALIKYDFKRASSLFYDASFVISPVNGYNKGFNKIFS
jgi:hypothetical protein